MGWLKILLLTVAAAVVYGILQDQVAVRVYWRTPCRAR
jgi:hypothetical protein